MVYTYTPTYYSSVQGTITSLCKTLLPFSFKTSARKRLGSLSHEQKLSKQQSDNLKWQQDMFHGILHKMGLQKEGILPENEVSAFRSQLLETIVTAPSEEDSSVIIRDKLQFLQELFYAECITGQEYHKSKRPLVLRLANQGAEINCKDVVFESKPGLGFENEEENLWSVVEFKDEQRLICNGMDTEKNRAKRKSPMKQMKGAMSKFSGFSKPHKLGKKRLSFEPLQQLNIENQSENTDLVESFGENPFWQDNKQGSILMPESSPPVSIKSSKRGEKAKQKVFYNLFQKEEREGGTGEQSFEIDENGVKPTKKTWGFDGLKKWKKWNDEDESTVPYLPPGERSDDVSSAPCKLVVRPIGEGPDTKLIKRKIHSNGSATDFFIDKVLGENINKELSRIQAELAVKNPNLAFTTDQIEAISTRLPVDKADLKKFFPKSWCDRYGDMVLDVVRKEFKEHIGEMEELRNSARERRSNSMAWRENNENFSPNLAFEGHGSLKKRNNAGSINSTTVGDRLKEDYYNYDSNANCFTNNPFYHSEYDANNDFRPESAFFHGSFQSFSPAAHRA